MKVETASDTNVYPLTSNGGSSVYIEGKPSAKEPIHINIDRKTGELSIVLYRWGISSLRSVAASLFNRDGKTLETSWDGYGRESGKCEKVWFFISFKSNNKF